jgi:hypothetical protein
MDGKSTGMCDNAKYIKLAESRVNLEICDRQC